MISGHDDLPRRGCVMTLLSVIGVLMFFGFCAYGVLTDKF